jgi:iron(III) transport system substrate-binding protein
VVALPLTDETLFLPNTVGVVRGAPHPAEAERLFEYLQNKSVSQKLVDAQALEGTSLDPARPEPGLKVDWDALLRDLDPATAEMEKIFLR